jgi:DNA primase
VAVDIVQEIKLRTDLVELISAYVPLKRAGGSYKGLCPFHQEKTPSFTVNPERQLFKCWGCGAGGDCFKFLELKEGLSFREAGEMLARKLGLEWVSRGDTAERRSTRERLYDINTLAERFFRKCLEESREAQAYLDKRGLSPETVQEFRLGYAPPGYEALLRYFRKEKVSLEDAATADLILPSDREQWRDRFVDRLMFPIADLEGRVVAFGGRTMRPDGIPKYLNSKETPVFSKGRTLYALNLAKKAIPEAGFAVAVEGYMDVIALHQAGVTNAVAGLGTAITDDHVGILGRYSRQLVMCYDGDGAGMRAVTANSSKFEAAGCEVKVARLPQGDDPDTFIRSHGVEQFRALLAQAEPILEYQLTNLRAGYNLVDESQRLPFVREAARIIAQSGSHIVRQEYAARLTHVLERLAEEWYPGDPQRAMQARLALSHEVARLLRTERPTGRYGPQPGPQPQPAHAAKAPVSARAGAERYIVRAALSEPRWAERVAEVAAPEQFSDLRLVGLAALLFGPGEDPLDARIQRIKLEPSFAETVSDLLMDEAPLSDEGLEECLQVLQRAGDNTRLAELQRLYVEGDLPADDPRREELRRLLAQRGGKQRRED